MAVGAGILAAAAAVCLLRVPGIEAYSALQEASSRSLDNTSTLQDAKRESSASFDDPDSHLSLSGMFSHGQKEKKTPSSTSNTPDEASSSRESPPDFNIDTFTFNKANIRKTNDIFSLLADVDGTDDAKYEREGQIQVHEETTGDNKSDQTSLGVPVASAANVPGKNILLATKDMEGLLSVVQKMKKKLEGRLERTVASTSPTDESSSFSSSSSPSGQTTSSSLSKQTSSSSFSSSPSDPATSTSISDPGTSSSSSSSNSPASPPSSISTSLHTFSSNQGQISSPNTVQTFSSNKTITSDSHQKSSSTSSSSSPSSPITRQELPSPNRRRKPTSSSNTRRNQNSSSNTRRNQNSPSNTRRNQTSSNTRRNQNFPSNTRRNQTSSNRRRNQAVPSNLRASSSSSTNSQTTSSGSTKDQTSSSDATKDQTSSSDATKSQTSSSSTNSFRSSSSSSSPGSASVQISSSNSPSFDSSSSSPFISLSHLPLFSLSHFPSSRHFSSFTPPSSFKLMSPSVNGFSSDDSNRSQESGSTSFLSNDITSSTKTSSLSSIDSDYSFSFNDSDDFSSSSDSNDFSSSSDSDDFSFSSDPDGFSSSHDSDDFSSSNDSNDYSSSSDSDDFSSSNGTSPLSSSPPSPSALMNLLLDTSTLERIRTAGLTSESEDEFLDHLLEVLTGEKNRQGTALTLDPVTVIALLTLAAYLIRAVYQILTVTGRSLEVNDMVLPLQMSDLPDAMVQIHSWISAANVAHVREERSFHPLSTILTVPGNLAAVIKLQREGHRACVKQFLCEQIQERPYREITFADILIAGLGYYFGDTDLGTYIDRTLSYDTSCEVVPFGCSPRTLSDAHYLEDLYSRASFKFFDLLAVMSNYL